MRLFVQELICILTVILPFSTLARPELTFVTIGNDAVNTGSTRIGDLGVEFIGHSNGFIGSTDDLLYAYGITTGNFVLEAHLSGFVDSLHYSEAGVMVRVDTTSSSPFVCLSILQERGMCIRYRSEAGNVVKTINITNQIYNRLRIEKKGNLYYIYYSSMHDPSWKKYSVAFKFNFPRNVLCGLMHISNDSTVTISRFDFLSGIPEEQSFQPECPSVKYEFNTGESLTAMGFQGVVNWNNTGAGYMQSEIPAGSRTSQITVPEFSLPVTPDTAFISWDCFIAGEPVSPLNDYGLFASEGILLKDRTTVAGALIGSASRVETAVEVTINSDIISGRDLVLHDRSIVNGNVTVHDTVELINGASITGSVAENTTIQIPSIPVKTISVGTTALNVNPNDSIDIIPGNYDRLIAYANSKLHFRPGIYNFRKFHIDTDVRLYLDANQSSGVELNIRDSIKISDRDTFFTVNTNSVQNCRIHCNQTGTIEFGTDLVLNGIFCFPYAEVKLMSRSFLLIGNMYVRRFVAEPDVNIAVSLTSSQLDTVQMTLRSSQSDEYSLKYLLHRNRQFNEISDFLLFHNDSLLAFDSSHKATPFNQWLEFKVSITTNQGSTSLMNLFFNDGHGLERIFSNIECHLDTVSEISYYYQKQLPAGQDQVRIDNIMISCDEDSCPALVVISQPENDSAYEGGSAQFDCEIDAVERRIDYQWFKNGHPVQFSNSASISFSGVTIDDNNSEIFCRVASLCDTITTDTVLLNVFECTPPEIYACSVSDTVSVGERVEIFVNAHGVDLSYQWRRNDKAINGAVGSRYVIESVQPENNMDVYSVIIQNGCQSIRVVDSIFLYVKGVASCKIIQHPCSDTLQEGDYYIGTVSTYCENENIQWYLNDLPIEGARQKEIIYGPVNKSDSGGVIRCVIDNGIKSDTSNPAYLSVIKAQPGNRIVAVSGELFDGNKNKMAKDSVVVFNFRVRLFNRQYSGLPLYTEYFSDKRAVIVRDGLFTVNLGRGDADHDLQKVVASNSNIYVEIAAGHFSNYEVIGPRLPFTAAPYAFASGVPLIYGNGAPGNSTAAPIGMLYIDQSDNNRVWKKTQNSWKRVD